MLSAADETKGPALRTVMLLHSDAGYLLDGKLNPKNSLYRLVLNSIAIIIRDVNNTPIQTLRKIFGRNFSLIKSCQNLLKI